ncbi:hypothetical protein Hypma_013906 [Hypsizygus marmoreus]|uniref:Uncharacterized protein n=1 Tax=Hypsizygus marmoreus TaxID=39966 RepID=A0A369KEC4_HYPMA|nr:hypothetical protein Hypma_013906 [Hypsizygus marmoreus]
MVPPISTLALFGITAAHAPTISQFISKIDGYPLALSLHFSEGEKDALDIISSSPHLKKRGGLEVFQLPSGEATVTLQEPAGR